MIRGLSGLVRQDWLERAVCSQTDPEQFFPEKGVSAAVAKKVCNTCPVQVECLTWALRNEEFYGIWGGTEHYERLRIGYRENATVAPVPDAPNGEDWHGTHYGARKHYREKTEVCRPCREAYNAYHRLLDKNRTG